MLYFTMLIVAFVDFIILLGFLLLIAKPNPFYDAQYLIPIAGMILGNTMNGAVLALNHYFNRISNDKKLSKLIFPVEQQPLNRADFYSLMH